MSLSRSVAFVFHMPFSSNNPFIWFLLHRELALWWKYLEFLSPSRSSISLALRNQYDSSCGWRVSSSLDKALHCSIMFASGVHRCAARNFFSESQIFLRSMPKVESAQEAKFEAQFSILKSMSDPKHSFHAVSTALPQSSFDSHSDSNLNNFLSICSIWFEWVVSIMGAWSDLYIAKWRTSKDGKMACHSVVAIKRSKRSLIIVDYWVPLLHVKVHRSIPRSHNPQSSRQPLKASISLSCLFAPPSFSYTLRISLKSPKATKGPPDVLWNISQQIPCLVFVWSICPTIHSTCIQQTRSWMIILYLHQDMMMRVWYQVDIHISPP